MRTRGVSCFFVCLSAVWRGRTTAVWFIFGNVVCADLACSLRIRNLIGAPPWASETMYLPARIWRMQRKMHKWLRKADRL